MRAALLPSARSGRSRVPWLHPRGIRIGPPCELGSEEPPSRGAPRAMDATRATQRADITFGLSGSPWDRARVLDRYELLCPLAYGGMASGKLDRDNVIQAF